MHLWPRLPLSRAREMAEEYSSLSIDELRLRAREWDDSVLFAPIGGQKVQRETVARIQSLIRLRADAARAAAGENEPKRRFDYEVSILLFEEMDISPHEASQLGVWAFLACVVLPDIVRWRFPREEGGTRSERFIGGARGVRNTFGRLWWRAWALEEADAADRWTRLRGLLEDQAVALLERPILCGYPPLARAALDGVETVVAEGGGRQDATRELAKRLRRIAAVTPFELLTAEQQSRRVAGAAAEVQKSLLGIRVSRQVGSLIRTTDKDHETEVRPQSAETSPAGAESVDGGHTPPKVKAVITDAMLRPGQDSVRVPFQVAEAMPRLDETYANPERNMIAVDENGRRWLWRFVHYNRAPRGGAEGYRLMGLAGYLAAHQAARGDHLLLTLADEEGMARVELLRGAGAADG